MTATDAERTPEEAKIDELKAKLADVITETKFEDHCYLLMWLKDSRFNVDKAEAKIRASIKWRREYGVDELADQDLCPKMAVELPTRIDGVSNAGYRVISVQAGVTDYRSVYEKHGHERFFTYWRQMIAKLELDVIRINKQKNSEATKLTAESVQGYTVVVDTKNFGMRQLHNPRLIAGFFTWMRETVNYYPGVNTIIYINVGPIFKMILKLIIPILESPSRKIEVYGTDQATLKNELFTRISPDQLTLPNDLYLH